MPLAMPPLRKPRSWIETPGIVRSASTASEMFDFSSVSPVTAEMLNGMSWIVCSRRCGRDDDLLELRLRLRERRGADVVSCSPAAASDIATVPRRHGRGAPQATCAPRPPARSDWPCTAYSCRLPLRSAGAEHRFNRLENSGPARRSHRSSSTTAHGSSRVRFLSTARTGYAQRPKARQGRRGRDRRDTAGTAPRCRGSS